MTAVLMTNKTITSCGEPNSNIQRENFPKAHSFCWSFSEELQGGND